MNKFSEATILQLIDYVSNEPGLYDKRHPNFKKLEWKQRTWTDIAINLDADKRDLRNAWRSLRDQFLKSLKEYNGDLTNDPTEYSSSKKKYKHFERLLFLKDSVDINPGRFNKYEELEEITVSEYNDIDFVSWDPTPTKSIKACVASPISNISETSIDLNSTSNTGSLATKRKAEDEEEGFLSKLAAKIYSKEPDNVEVFFQSVAKTVQSYELSHTELSALQCEVLVFVTERLNNIEKQRNRVQRVQI